MRTVRNECGRGAEAVVSLGRFWVGFFWNKTELSWGCEHRREAFALLFKGIHPPGCCVDDEAQADDLVSVAAIGQQHKLGS